MTSRNRRSLLTKNRILAESTRLFLENSYHGTSIDEITRAANLTKGAFYWHFKSKEDLLRKIIKEYETHYLEGLFRAVGEMKGGAFDKFGKYLRYNVAFAYYNRELCVSFDTLAAELVGANHEIETLFRRIYKRHQKFLSDLILQGKKEKVFRKEIDENLAAFGIIAFHSGVLVQWSMNRDKIKGEVFVKTFKQIILNGLMA
jgi:AcrR family transcriptional regulator